MQVGSREEFKLSGRVDSALFPIASFGTVILCAVLGAGYGFLDAYNPSAKLAVLVTLLFAAGAGGLSGALMRRCRVRSLPIAFALVLAGQAIGYYLSWCTWIFAIHQRVRMYGATISGLATAPHALWQRISEINHVGAWSLGSSSHDPVSGTMLWAAWAGEAAMMLIVPLFIVPVLLGLNVYCEECGDWVPESADVAKLAPGSQVEIRESLRAGDLSYLEGLGLPSDGSSFTALDLHECPTCQATRALTAKVVALVPNKKGELKRSESVAVDRLLLTGEEASWVRALPARLAAAGQTG